MKPSFYIANCFYCEEKRLEHYFICSIYSNCRICPNLTVGTQVLLFQTSQGKEIKVGAELVILLHTVHLHPSQSDLSTWILLLLSLIFNTCIHSSHQETVFSCPLEIKEPLAVYFCLSFPLIINQNLIILPTLLFLDSLSILFSGKIYIKILCPHSHVQFTSWLAYLKMFEYLTSSDIQRVPKNVYAF